MIYIFILIAFIIGYAIGEQKYLLTDYWQDLEDFLNKRDQIIINRLKK